MNIIASISQQKISVQQIIKVVPENYVVFQCEDDQPMGQVKISFLPTKAKQKQIPQLQYQLMATNKANYKVSNAKGVICSDKKAALIRIYIKNTENLQKCLCDKFRLRITDTKAKSFVDYKLKVLIEKQVSNAKLDQLNGNQTQTISKSGISVYTNPSVLASTTSSDHLRSTLYFSDSILKQDHKSHISNLNATQLVSTKQSFDDSTHSLSRKKKQLQIVQQSLGKQRARQKFCLFWIIFVFLFCVLMGFCFKKATNKSLWTNIIRRMRKNTTWQILQEGQYNHILRWSTDGTSFQILNQQTLSSEVLPKYFKHSNFSSFIRQLNMYNFHKKKASDNSMEFYHKLFRQSKKQLLIGIKRKPSQAQIQYGDQLIRKMIKETGSKSNSKPPSRESSQSDENYDIHNQNTVNQHRQKCKSTFYEPVFLEPSSQMVYYQFWPNMNPPLEESNRQNMSNYNMQTMNCNKQITNRSVQTKIITNIIIKNPPASQIQSDSFYQGF